MTDAISSFFGIAFCLFIFGLLWYFIRRMAKTFSRIRSIQETQAEILHELIKIREGLDKESRKKTVISRRKGMYQVRCLSVLPPPIATT